MTVRHRFAVAATIAVGATGMMLASALPANAANFDGYSSTNWGGTLLVSSSTTANTTVDIADNDLASAVNGQSRRWCAVNQEGGFNVIRFKFAPSTSVGTLGTYNDTTDWLWAGTAGGCNTA